MAAQSRGGRLTQGAGTHLASWLQEVGNIPEEEALAWLGLGEEEEQGEHERENNKIEDARKFVAELRKIHGKNCGHSGPLVDADASGDLIVTKCANSMRLWRKRGGSLLRVVGGCPGNRVAFSPSGSIIVTLSYNSLLGHRKNLKIWGPAGASAVGCGNTKITAGKVP
ncbi:unnamed protein product [Amoebophrya sp. A25]|nr:unnamed protein product [Amoebophrya sp. A25]|eukprot:GSA25T00016402001.1